MATKAYILIKVKAGKTKDVVKALKTIPGVHQVHPCFGQPDIFSFIEVHDEKALSDVVISKIHIIDGVERPTRTSSQKPELQGPPFDMMHTISLMRGRSSSVIRATRPSSRRNSWTPATSPPTTRPSLTTSVPIATTGTGPDRRHAGQQRISR